MTKEQEIFFRACYHDPDTMPIQSFMDVFAVMCKLGWFEEYGIDRDGKSIVNKERQYESKFS